jgi:membrane protease YdiL (CAAX protease family)
MLAALAVPLAAFGFAALWLLYLPISFVAPGVVTLVLSDNSFPILVAGRPWLSLANALLVVGAAPIAEEVVFRGVLLERWTVKWSPAAAVATSAVAFGVLHVDPLGAIAFGALMALVYMRTRTLLVPMLCHALFNGALLAVDLATGDEGTAYTVERFRADWPEAAVALLLSAPILLIAARRLWPPTRVPLQLAASGSARQEPSAPGAG